MRRLVLALSLTFGLATFAAADTGPIVPPIGPIPTPQLNLPPIDLHVSVLSVPVIDGVFTLGTGTDFEITMKTFGVKLCYDHRADFPTIGPEGFRCDDDFVRVRIDGVAVPRRSLHIAGIQNLIEITNQTLTAGKHEFVVEINAKPVFDIVRTSKPVFLTYFPPVPTPVIQAVNLNADGYEIVGSNFGNTATGVLIIASATAPNPDFASYTPGAADIVSYGPTRIVIRTDAVMGSVGHQIFVPDPHYPNRASNVFTKSHPLRVSLGSVTPDLVGYVVTTNHFGTDLDNVIVMEGATQVPAAKLRKLDATSLHVDDRLSGTVTHQLLSHLPGVSASRALTVTHPTRPIVTGIRMTEYGLDVRGSHFGTDPSKVSVTFVATGRTVSNNATNAPFLHGLTDTTIAVNFLGACRRLFASPAQSLTTDLEVLLLTGNQTGFFAPTFRTTIPPLGAEYAPTLTAVNPTADGLELLGTHLGEPTELCELRLQVLGANGQTLTVSGGNAAARFVSVSNTRWAVDLSGLTSITGDRDVIVSRAGVASARFHLAGGAQASAGN